MIWRVVLTRIKGVIQSEWLMASPHVMRLNALLLLALIATAMAVVHTQYESRRVFVKLESLQAEARQLRNEHDGLQAQQRELATSLRVDKAAREKLGMLPATPATTQYVTPSVVPSKPQP
jgi:cell division protein FtsL